jgi:hypothetical protein
MFPLQVIIEELGGGFRRRPAKATGVWARSRGMPRRRERGARTAAARGTRGRTTGRAAAALGLRGGGSVAIDLYLSAKSNTVAINGLIVEAAVWGTGDRPLSIR